MTTWALIRWFQLGTDSNNSPTNQENYTELFVQRGLSTGQSGRYLEHAPQAKRETTATGAKVSNE